MLAGELRAEVGQPLQGQQHARRVEARACRVVVVAQPGVGGLLHGVRVIDVAAADDGAPGVVGVLEDPAVGVFDEDAAIGDRLAVASARATRARAPRRAAPSARRAPRPAAPTRARATAIALSRVMRALPTRIPGLRAELRTRRTVPVVAVADEDVAVVDRHAGDPLREAHVRSERAVAHPGQHERIGIEAERCRQAGEGAAGGASGPSRGSTRPQRSSRRPGRSAFEPSRT